MKKFLAVLLVICISLSFTLASCKGGEENVKPSDGFAEASVSDRSDLSLEDPSVSNTAEADNTEPSSEDVSSEEASATTSSEDNTTEEVSLTPPVISQAPDITDLASEETGDIVYKTTEAKVNYALNKEYVTNHDTTDVDHPPLYYGVSKGDYSWADNEHKKLTDGIVGNLSDPEYKTELAAKEGVTVIIAGTNKLREFIVDLGEHYGDISSIVIRNVRNGVSNGNSGGFKLSHAYVSDDNIYWTKIATDLTAKAIDGAPEIKAKDKDEYNVEHFDYTYTFKNAAMGRYVRFVFVSDGAYLIQFEEVEVWN